MDISARGRALTTRRRSTTADKAKPGNGKPGKG
jgi:hypothetical protein